MSKPDPHKSTDRRAGRPAGTAASPPRGASAKPPLRPLVWIKRFFARDLKLKRSGGHFHVGWEETMCRDVAAPAGAAPGGPAIDPASMHAQLRSLMGRHPDTRQLMRHLAFIERALQLTGPAALVDLPQEVLRKGLLQLESLVQDWSSAGLTELRVRLGDAIEVQQGEAQSFAPTNSKLSDFQVSQRLQVSDATPSAFEELERIWTEHRPDVAEIGKDTKS
jgi:hypothetical protein